MRSIKASEFKAKCLKLMDEVAATGEPIEITKDAKPVARLVPPLRRAKSPFGLHKGQIKILGDIIEPIDVEWAIAGSGLSLVQARPITALPHPPWIVPPGEGFWEKDEDHYPMPLTPFGSSVYLPAIDAAASVMGRDFGLLLEGLEQRSLGGEVYTHPIPLGGKERRPPPSWLMWVAARTVPALRRRNRVAEQAITAGFSEQLLDRWDTEWRDAFRDEAESFKRVDLGALSDEDLLAHLDRLKDFLDRGQVVHFRLNGAYMVPLYDLWVACEELLSWDSVASLALVAGASDVSAEPGRELHVLASTFASDAEAFSVLDDAGDDVLARLKEASPESAEAFRTYLDRYGHRTVGYDPGDPTLFERPALLAGLLRDCVTVGGGDQQGGSSISEPALGRARAALADAGARDPARDRRGGRTAGPGGGHDADRSSPPNMVPAAGTPGERVVRERRSLLTLRADDPAAQAAQLTGTGRRSESVIRTPILSGEEVLGILSVHSYTSDRYTEQDVEVVEVIASLAATALSNLRLNEERRAAAGARPDGSYGRGVRRPAGPAGGDRGRREQGQCRAAGDHDLSA